MTIGLNQSNGVAAGLAGGIIAVEILETLFDKGILNRDECRAVLSRAMTGLAPIANTVHGSDAQRIIGALQAGKFSERS